MAHDEQHAVLVILTPVVPMQARLGLAVVRDMVSAVRAPGELFDAMANVSVQAIVGLSHLFESLPERFRKLR